MGSTKTPPSGHDAGLLTELQSAGMRWRGSAGLHRVGGAGPSDHKAIRIAGQTVMMPIVTHAAAASPFEAVSDGDKAVLHRDGERVAEIAFPPHMTVAVSLLVAPRVSRSLWSIPAHPAK